MNEPGNEDQTAEIVQELLLAERRQEIIQATTLQGQIVALVLVLQDLGVLDKSHIDRWETTSEVVTNLLIRIARESMPQNDAPGEELYKQVEKALDGVEAALEFSRLLGNSEKDLRPLIDRRNELKKKLEDLRNGT